MKNSATEYLPITLTPILSSIGDRLAMARKRRKISQKQISERTGMSPATISRLENGHPGTTITTLAAYLYAINMESELLHFLAPENDKVGLQLDMNALPQRIHAEKDEEFN